MVKSSIFIYSLIFEFGYAQGNVKQYVRPSASDTELYKKHDIVGMHDMKCKWKCRVAGWCNMNADLFYLPGGAKRADAWEIVSGKNLPVCKTFDKSKPKKTVKKSHTTAAPKKTERAGVKTFVPVKTGKTGSRTASPEKYKITKTDKTGSTTVFPGKSGTDKLEEAQPCEENSDCKTDICCPKWKVCIEKKNFMKVASANEIRSFVSKMCKTSCGGACDIVGESMKANTVNPFFATVMKKEIFKLKSLQGEKGIKEIFETARNWLKEQGLPWKAEPGKCSASKKEKGLYCKDTVKNCKSCDPTEPDQCAECKEGFLEDCGDCVAATMSL